MLGNLKFESIDLAFYFILIFVDSQILVLYTINKFIPRDGLLYCVNHEIFLMITFFWDVTPLSLVETSFRNVTRP